MCDHHKELSELCPKGYHSLGTIIESKIKEELQKLIADLVLKGTENTIELEDKQLVTTLSTMLSWGYTELHTHGIRMEDLFHQKI